MHQTRASIGSTISQAISGGMLAWLMAQSLAEGLACAGKCKVNSSMSLQEVGKQPPSVTSEDHKPWKSWGSSPELWRRRGLFKFLAPAPLSWPAHLAYSTLLSTTCPSTLANQQPNTHKPTHPNTLLPKSGDKARHQNASSPAQESQDREEDPGQTVRNLPPLTNYPQY
jgi:hypothetical protein